jgi:hypothetical protein
VYALEREEPDARYMLTVAIFVRSKLEALTALDSGASARRICSSLERRRVRSIEVVSGVWGGAAEGAAESRAIGEFSGVCRESSNGVMLWCILLCLAMSCFFDKRLSP